MRWRTCLVSAVWVVGSLGLGWPSVAAETAPLVPLPAGIAKDLQPLGAGVVGAALPARPLTEPSRLRPVEPGVGVYWSYGAPTIDVGGIARLGYEYRSARGLTTSLICRYIPRNRRPRGLPISTFYILWIYIQLC